MNEVLYYGGSVFKDYHKSLYIGLFLSNREVLNIPAMNHIRPADFLPRCVFSKRLRYEKQIKTIHLFRLLSLEMLHGDRKT